MDHFFPTDGMSESDRTSALNRLIQEFGTLKDQGNDELIHKRRQMLLSIWGDLVLARTDPSQIDMPTEASAETAALDETNALGEEPGAVAHEDAGDLISEASEAIERDINADDSVLNTVAASDDEIHSENDHDGALINEAHSEESTADDVALHESVENHDELDPISHDIVDDHNPAPMIHAANITPHTQTQHSENVISEDVSSTQEHVSHAIKALDEASITNFVIHDRHEDHEAALHVIAAIPAAHHTAEATLAQIFDVNSSAEQPLLEIKNIDEVEHKRIDQTMINPENIEEEIPDMVRLRLLKTGTLHDMVLPQGTIISTNFADAEELISSGTAEKLLIQTEPTDH